MAKIDMAQFLGKSKEYTIDGQKVMLEPLKGKDIDLLLGMKEGKEVDGIRNLVKASFDLTDAEFDVLPVTFLNAAVEAVLDVNGLMKKKGE